MNIEKPRLTHSTPFFRVQTPPYGRRFAELAALLEVGKVVRTDKLSIIADAVKEVTKLRAESHQLRQLNKFLEVWPCTCTRLHACTVCAAKSC